MTARFLHLDHAPHFRCASLLHFSASKLKLFSGLSSRKHIQTTANGCENPRASSYTGTKEHGRTIKGKNPRSALGETVYPHRLMLENNTVQPSSTCNLSGNIRRKTHRSLFIPITYCGLRGRFIHTGRQCTLRTHQSQCFVREEQYR